MLAQGRESAGEDMPRCRGAGTEQREDRICRGAGGAEAAGNGRHAEAAAEA